MSEDEKVPLSLSDGIVRLAPFTTGDAQTIMEWDTDTDIQHWFDWPLTTDGKRQALQRYEAEQVAIDKRKSWGTGKEFAFVIHDEETGEGLGWVDVQPEADGRANVSYAVLARHRGRGIATRSVKLVTEYAFAKQSYRSFKPLPSRMRSVCLSIRAVRVFDCLAPEKCNT